MRPPLRLVATFLASVLLPFGLAPASAQTASSGATAAADGGASARVIVKLKSSSDLLRKSVLSAGGTAIAAPRAEQMRSLGQRLGVSLRTGYSLGERSQVVFASGISSTALAERLSAQSDVEYAEVDVLRHALAVPNDPLYAASASVSPQAGQWYLRPPAGAVVSAVNAESAWDLVSGNTNKVVVAMLDTGVRFDHPDLLTAAQGGSLLPGYDMVHDAAMGSDAQATGTTDQTRDRDADPSDPGDFVTLADIRNNASLNGCDVQATSTWHGTETSGLVAALTGNGIGLASMSGPGRNLLVLPVRVLGKCGGYDSDIQAGIRWAAGLSVGVEPAPVNPTPARVINMSLGGTGACTRGYTDAVAAANAAGAVVVAAAGNSEGLAVGTPANCTGVIAVAGLRHSGTKVGFSDLGPEVAISAPGGNCVNSTGECIYPILSTTNAGSTTPVVASAAYTNGSNYSVGTSFSAPLVSGTVGLMFAAQPALTPADVRRLLLASVRSFPSTGGTAGIAQCHAPTSAVQDECYCTTATCGAGMLDSAAAVQASLRLSASITSTVAAPIVGQLVTLNAAASLPTGQTSVSYRWTLVDGGGIVTGLSGDVTSATVTATPTASGSFTVSVTVTDTAGDTATSTKTVAVVVAASTGGTSTGGSDGSTPTPGTTSTDSGGGGGSFDLALLLSLGALAAAGRAMRPARRADAS